MRYLFSSVNIPITGLLGFVTIAHGQDLGSCQAGQFAAMLQ
jgi:hypothetical protein